MEWLLDTQHWLYSGAIDIVREFGSGADGGVSALIATGFLFGLLHAFLPGHGKLLLSTYYAGGGEWRGAVAASMVLIATHVGSAIVIVLGGFAIIQRTIGGAGRAPVLEAASHIFILLIGLWLLWKAARPHGYPHHDNPSSLALAFGAGLIPCPLTAFMLTFALANGLIAAGLLLSTAFAAGAMVTVALFPVLSIAVRDRLLPLIAASEGWRSAVGHGIEILAALGIIALGLVPTISSILR